MDILDALSRSDRIRHVTTRHEQGAAFMADVHGRLTGRARRWRCRPSGPGATNLVTGVADAFLDRAPMVAITGQTGSDKLHKEAHQLVDIVRMFDPVTKWNTRVERIDAIPEIVRKAFRVAELEKPGPTHIELPENLAAMAPESGSTRSGRSSRPGRTSRSRPTRRSPTPPGSSRPRAGRSSWPATASSGAALGRAARVRPRPPRPGRGHVHGQGRRRRPVAPVAHGGRAPGPRPRPDRLRPGRPRRVRRLRPGRVRAEPLEPGRDEADRPHRHPAGRGRRRLPADGRADRRHRRDARAAARGAAAARDRRPRRDRSATSRRRSWSTPTCGSPLLRDLEAYEADDGFPVRPQKAIADLRRALGPDDIVVSRRRRPQGLGRPALPGLRAEHGDHLERIRGDGHLAARGDRRQARPSRSAGSSPCAATAAS